MTFRSTSQIVVIRTSFCWQKPCDVIHAPALDAADGDAERIIGPGGLGVGLVFAGRVRLCQARNRGHGGRDRGAILKEDAARKSANDDDPRAR